MADEVCVALVEYLEGDATSEADLFGFAVLVHMGFDGVAGDNDVVGCVLAHNFLGAAAGEVVPVPGEFAKDNVGVGEDVDIAVGDFRVTTAEGGGGAKIELDGVEVGGLVGWLFPFVLQVLQAVITGKGMAAGTAEDFGDVELLFFQLDGWSVGGLKEVLDEGVKERGVEKGDAEPAFLTGGDAALAFTAVAVAV